MKHISIALAAIMASAMVTAGSAAAIAATDDAVPKPAVRTAKVADKDFGRLSRDGASAFDDVHLARMAIYDGQTNEAAELIADAQTSLGKAGSDDTAFTKAESELNTPSGKMSGPQTGHPKNTTPVAWIPVDGEVELGETFVSTPKNAAAVVTARKSLEKGDTAKSLEAIKLAAVDVDYTMAIIPLEASISEVSKANGLMDNHDYYGASQALRQVELGIRYDETDDVANVKGSAKTASSGK
jgi:hypothetical protein